MFYRCSKINDKFPLTYYPTHIRYSPWLIGVMFGYIMLELRKLRKVHIPKVFFSKLLLIEVTQYIFLFFHHLDRL